MKTLTIKERILSALERHACRIFLLIMVPTVTISWVLAAPYAFLQGSLEWREHKRDIAEFWGRESLIDLFHALKDGSFR